MRSNIGYYIEVGLYERIKKMKNSHLKVLVIILAVLLVASVTALVIFLLNQNGADKSPDGDTEVKEDFDYLGADLSQYITLNADAYQSNTVTLGTEYLVDDALVQKYIDEERFQNRQKEGVDGRYGEQYTDKPVRYADTAAIRYIGYIDGKTFEGGSNVDAKYSYELAIGSGAFIPGFEDALIGVIPANTSKENPHRINVTFPEDYDHEDLAGKAAVFDVWIEYTIMYYVPEFNDDYVATILKFNGSAEAYREQVRQNLENASKDSADEQAVAAIISQLAEKAVIIEYPEQSVTYWYNQYIAQFDYYMQYYQSYGYTFASLDEFIIAYAGLAQGTDVKATVTDYAKSMVKNNLIYYTIAKQQGFNVSEEEYNNGVKALAEYYTKYYTEYYTNYYGYEYKVTYTEADVIAEMGEARLKQNMLFEKVDAYLLEHCTIEYKDVE